MMAGWGGSRSSFRHVLLLLYLIQKMGSLSLSHSLSWMNEGMAKFGAMSCPIIIWAQFPRVLVCTKRPSCMYYECNFIVQSEQK